MKDKDVIVTTVILPSELHKRIRVIADEEERSMTYMIVKLLEKQLTI